MQDCIVDSLWGEMPIRRSKRAKRVIFKTMEGRLCVVVPCMMRVDEGCLQRLIDDNRVALGRMLAKSQSRMEDCVLYDGKEIKICEVDIVIKSDDLIERNCVMTELQDGKLYIRYSACNDITEVRYARFVSRCMVLRLRKSYGKYLCDMVREYAQRYSLNVKDVRVGTGRSVLGHCSRAGVITISAYVLLYPLHLRRFIVCHELAHLTHFNHGSDFHRLCNLYCDGNERLWSAESKQYAFPIL